MKQPRHAIVKVIADKLSTDSVDTGAVSREVAGYLLEAGRTGELDSLMRDVMQYRAERGIVEVVASSAFPLSDAVKSDIDAEVRRSYPDAAQVIVSQRHDPSIIAGVTLDFAQAELDLSIEGKLQRFKQLTQTVHAGKAQ